MLMPAIFLAVLSRAEGEMAVAELFGDITLEQVLKLADESNPGILAARFELQAAEGRKLQAGVRPNPDLSFEAENVLGRNEMKGFDSAEYTVQLEQQVEIVGKRSGRVKKAELERQLSAFDLAALHLDTEAETTRRFTAVQGAQEQVALSKEILALAEEFQKAVSARVKAGKVSPLEEEKAVILLARQKAELFQAEKELAGARVKLAAMWGSANTKFDRATGEFFAVPSSVDVVALTASLKESPDVARWKTEVEQKRVALKVEKVSRIPDLTVAGGIRRFNESGDDAYVLGVSIPFPLFDRNQGNVKESAALLSAAEKQKLSAEVLAGAELAEAAGAFAAATNKVTVLQAEIIPRARSVYDSIKSGYQQGKFTYLEVLDAQSAFCEAKKEYIDVMVLCHKTTADIRRIAGISRLNKKGNNNVQ